MHNFQRLEVWNASIELSDEVHQITKTFPKYELYGITSQIRRSSVSIPSNIAEGAGRKSNKEFLQFLSIANGSAYELFTQLILAFKAEYLDEENKNKLINKLNSIIRMLYKLIQKFSE